MRNWAKEVKELLFIQPYRLGDVLIQSGMVHHLSTKYDKVHFPIHKSCVEMKWNLDFNDNVVVDTVDYPICECSEMIIKDFGFDLDKIDVVNMLIGFGQVNDALTLPFTRSGKKFDVYKYELLGLSVQDKWDKFKFRRNVQREQALCDKLNIKKPYIFKHDGGSHKLYHIQKQLIPSNINIFQPTEGMTDNIFDYLKVIEDADAVHCIDSAFSNLIDLTGVGKNNFFHRYARCISPVSINEKLWNEITYTNGQFVVRKA